jgi:hypothetical protein
MSYGLGCRRGTNFAFNGNGNDAGRMDFFSLKSCFLDIKVLKGENQEYFFFIFLDTKPIFPSYSICFQVFFFFFFFFFTKPGGPNLATPSPRDPRKEKVQPPPEIPPPAVREPQKKFDMSKLKFMKIVRSVSNDPKKRPVVKMFEMERRSELDYHEPEVPITRQPQVVRTFAPPPLHPIRQRFTQPLNDLDANELNLFGPPIRRVHPE